MGFGHVIAAHRHTLIVERGVSFVAFDERGRPLRTAYASNIFAPQARYLIDIGECNQVIGYSGDRSPTGPPIAINADYPSYSDYPIYERAMVEPWSECDTSIAGADRRLRRSR